MRNGAESHQYPRVLKLVRNTLLACALLSAPALYAGDEGALLAPTGRLRVGVYAGSPTSMVTDPASHETHGV
jgi:polar amino acid transport system substrate-binding protein